MQLWPGYGGVRGVCRDTLGSQSELTEHVSTSGSAPLRTVIENFRGPRRALPEAVQRLKWAAVALVFGPCVKF